MNKRSLSLKALVALVAAALGVTLFGIPYQRTISYAQCSTTFSDYLIEPLYWNYWRFKVNTTPNPETIYTLNSRRAYFQVFNCLCESKDEHKWNDIENFYHSKEKELGMEFNALPPRDLCGSKECSCEIESR